MNALIVRDGVPCFVVRRGSLRLLQPHYVFRSTKADIEEINASTK